MIEMRENSYNNIRKDEVKRSRETDQEVTGKENFPEGKNDKKNQGEKDQFEEYNSWS
jgi:hypothetical protein